VMYIVALMLSEIGLALSALAFLKRAQGCGCVFYVIYCIKSALDSQAAAQRRVLYISIKTSATRAIYF
jgi:hypothetical protein